MGTLAEPGSPLLIGGVGGSGTRVYRAIAEVAGYRMLVAPWFRRILGRALHDNLLLNEFFYGRWVNPYLNNEISDAQLKAMQASCKVFLWMCGPLMYDRGLWGWKNPRTIFLIPFFNEMYPSMRFIHVIRDGRDHAFHPRFPYLAHQEGLLSAGETKLPDPQRKALYWSRVNRMGEAYAKEYLPGRYLQSTLETLCGDPVREVARILAFLGSRDQEAMAERASRLVKTPSSFGRWRHESPDQIAAVEELIGKDLLRYGHKQTPVVGHPFPGSASHFER